MGLINFLLGRSPKSEEKHYKALREPRDYVKILENPNKPDSWENHSLGSWLPKDKRETYIKELSL